MGLVAYQLPLAWESPGPLRTPLEINQKAEEALGRSLKMVASKGLIPILRLEFRLVGPSDAVGIAASYADPSRNLDQFYRMYQEHVVTMTRLAARNEAAMVILAVSIPHLAGAGQATFADGSNMADRQELIRGKWSDIIGAARITAGEEGRPDLLFAYLERNVWPTASAGRRTAVWQRVTFWNAVDAIGIGVCLTEGFEAIGQSIPRTVDELISSAEKRKFVEDGIPKLLDIGNYFRLQAMHMGIRKPVFVDEIDCMPAKVGAQTPAASVSLSHELTGRQRFYLARMELARRHGGDWLAGLGFVQRVLRDVPGEPTGFLGTEAEDHVRHYFLGTAAPFGELVANPGFEFGNAVPWSLQDWGGRPQLGLDTRRVHAGRWALRIANKDSLSEGAALSGRIPVRAGVQYRLSAWLFLEDARGVFARFSARWYGKEDRVISTSRSTLQERSTASWVHDSVDVKAPEGAVYARIVLYASAAGTAYFDDVSFRRSD